MNETAAGYARLTVNVPLELKQRVQLICARRQLSMREYLTQAGGTADERFGFARRRQQSTGPDSASRSGVGRIMG